LAAIAWLTMILSRLTLRAALLRRSKFCDPPIQLPKLYVPATSKLLGFFFGRLIVGANNIDAIPNMPVRA
jgi:hypothetical protein